MAVMCIWPIRGRIEQVIEYVCNPEKTDSALQDVLGYAADGEKTEQGIYVSGINCDAMTAAMQFDLVKRQFGKEGGIIAYHAYQSFAKGEISPTQAHEVGKAFAEKVWGKGYQVVVTTHLNSNCLHNHFVVNSVSFLDGKRCREKQWRELSKISDEICKEYALSTVDKTGSKRISLPIYQAEKKGEPTRLNLAKAAIDEALIISRNLPQLQANLRKQGYICRFDANRKYWTIKQKDWERPIRLIRMGEEYSNAKILERLRNPLPKIRKNDVPLRVRSRKKRVLQIKKPRKIGGLRGLYLHYCYLLGVFPRNKGKSPRQIHYLYRDDLLKLKNITDETRLLCKYGIETKEQLQDFLGNLETEIKQKAAERNDHRNAIRRVEAAPMQISAEKARITEITAELRQLRRQVYLCQSISDRAGVLRKKMHEVSKGKKKKRGELER